MIYKIIVFLSFFSLFYINGLSQVNDDINLDYIEIKEMYPERMVEHFPELKNDMIAYKFLYPRGKYLNSIQLILYRSDYELMTLKNELDSKAKEIYHFTDTCLSIVEYDPEIYRDASFELKMCNSSTQKLPIPNFILLKKLQLPADFSEYATIYVLDAEKGKFFDDEYLTRNGVGLSNEWLHGYTKGVLILKNVAFYWLEVW